MGIDIEITEAERNQGYVDHINSNQKAKFTYEQLKSMGLPTYINEKGYITWE
jgi:hypothetical protein